MDGECLRDIYSARSLQVPLWNMGLGTVVLRTLFGKVCVRIPARGRVAIIRYRSVRALDESLFEINHPAHKEIHSETTLRA